LIVRRRGRDFVEGEIEKCDRINHRPQFHNLAAR
jgi:hypothetical protein